MKKRLYIIGAGSVGGHLALNIQDYSEQYEVAGFFDDDPAKLGTSQFGYDVLGPISEVLRLRDVNVALGIAFPMIKRKIVGQISENNSLAFPSFIHPRAWISERVEIGKGCIIYPGTMINYGCQIGDFSVINMNCALGHHTQVGAYSSLAPGVNTGGHTIIGDEVELGIGASTIQHVQIGSKSVVGGQSMVISDVEADTKVVGVPAKSIVKKLV